MSKLGIDQTSTRYLMTRTARASVDNYTADPKKEPIKSIDVCELTRSAIAKVIAQSLSVSQAPGIKLLFKNIDAIVEKAYKPAYRGALKFIGSYGPLKLAIKDMRIANKSITAITDITNDIYGTVASISSVALSSLTNPFMVVTLGIQAGLDRVGLYLPVGTIIKILLITVAVTVVGGMYNFFELISSL